MFREVIFKLASATLLLVGIVGLVFGFLIGNKSMQATGFISGIMSLVLIYYLMDDAEHQAGRGRDKIRPDTGESKKPGNDRRFF